MYLRLLASTVGVSIFLNLLFFALRIRRAEKIDWDGLAERFFIVLLFSAGTIGYLIIPPVIIGRVIFYLNSRGDLWFVRKDEPAVEMQKSQFKTEMLLELILSPALAILICLIL